MEKTVYICVYWSSYNKELQYTLQGYKPAEGSELALLEAREISFETPNDVTLRMRVAEALRGKKNRVLAEAHIEAKGIEETIQELLAIEDKSAESPEHTMPETEDDIPS